MIKKLSQLNAGCGALAIEATGGAAALRRPLGLRKRSSGITPLNTQQQQQQVQQEQQQLQQQPKQQQPSIL
ncbi:hypothetical protein Emed_002174 [Eimeria media]